MKKILILILAVFIPSNVSAYTVAVVSDIHAGDESIRDYSSYEKGNITYPNRWEQCLKTIKADLVISAGDNVNNKKACNLYPRISKYVNLMAKGNHDTCFPYKANRTFENNKVKVILTTGNVSKIKSKNKTIIVSHFYNKKLKGKADYVFFGHEHVKNTKNFIPALTLNGKCNIRYINLK